MHFVKQSLLFFVLLVAVTHSTAQQKLYDFLKDDSIAKESLYKDALADKDKLVKSLGKEHKSDYKEWYESRFEIAGDLFKSSTTVTEPAAHAYLQSLLQKIVSANPELKDIKTRLVFTRDGWANAYCVGEGTLVVNAGLLIHLENEAQLVFILCHEIAHLYLDHSGKRIKKSVEFLNSTELKKELKALSKQKYGVGEKLEEMGKRYAFGFLRHNREDEKEADTWAFRFMKNTGFDCNQALTGLALLDKLNDSTTLAPVDIKKIFSFSEYPFKEKWIKQESTIFSALPEKDESKLTKAEKDSLKTHPDIPQRIEWLEVPVKSASPGSPFLVNETKFQELKKQFTAEIVEQLFEYKNLTGHLFLALQLLDNPAYKDYAAYAVLRCLNRLYQHQRDHTLGLVTDKETRYYTKDYNLLLRMVDRLKLDDIANLAFHFAKQHQHLAAHKAFADEMRIAQKNRAEN